MSRILPPKLGQSRNPETPFTVVPFVDLPGVSADRMLVVNHLMAYNHDVSQEVDQTFFLITDTDEVRRVVSGPQRVGEACERTSSPWCLRYC